MDKDPLYLALSEKELYDCIWKESKIEREILLAKDCKEYFTANATTNFFPRTFCTERKKHDKRERGILKNEIRCTELLCSFRKPIIVMTPIPTNTNSAARA